MPGACRGTNMCTESCQHLLEHENQQLRQLIISPMSRYCQELAVSVNIVYRGQGYWNNSLHWLVLQRKNPITTVTEF